LSRPFIAFRHSDGVIGTTKVEFGGHGGRTDAVEEIWSQSEWVSVLLRDAVVSAVVYGQAERAVLLYKE